MYFKHFQLNTTMSKNGWEEWQRSTWGISPAKETNRRLLGTFALHNKFVLLASPDSGMCIEGAAVWDHSSLPATTAAVYFWCQFPVRDPKERTGVDYKIAVSIKSLSSPQSLTSTSTGSLPKPWKSVNKIQVSILAMRVLSWEWGPGSCPNSMDHPQSFTLNSHWVKQRNSQRAEWWGGATVFSLPHTSLSCPVEWQGSPCCSLSISVPALSLLLPGEVSSAIVPPIINTYIPSPYEKYPYAAAQPEISKQNLFLHELKQSFGGFFVVQDLPLTGKCRMSGSWAKSFTNTQQNKTPAKIFQIYDVIYLHLKTTPTWWHLNHACFYNRDFPSSTSTQFILQCSGVSKDIV